jgi:hypothetical protein
VNLENQNLIKINNKNLIIIKKDVFHKYKKMYFWHYQTPIGVEELKMTNSVHHGQGIISKNY